MKIAAALLALASVASATKISHKAARKLVRSARKLEDKEGDDAVEDDNSFLGYYDVKMVGCKSGLENPITNADGEYEYEAVLLRLCPTASGCDSTSTMGCKDGYGDLLVGVSTFVEAYMQDIAEDQDEDGDGKGDDAYADMDKFAKCDEYNPDENYDDAAKGTWDDYSFYVGPTCTEDGMNIKLSLFTDQYCTQTSDIAFETISNGWTLPYSEGGLVSSYCSTCSEYNEDGEVEISEMCQKTYEESALKCEAEMEYYSYYGQNVAGCETIKELFPKGGNGGKIFGWFVFICVIGGLVGYVMWWRKKKSITIE